MADDFRPGISAATVRAIDCASEVAEIENEVTEFRFMANMMLATTLSFSRATVYAHICDLAGDHDVWLGDNTEAQDTWADWNDLTQVSHEPLPALEAAIREAAADQEKTHAIDRILKTLN